MYSQLFKLFPAPQPVFSASNVSPPIFVESCQAHLKVSKFNKYSFLLDCELCEGRAGAVSVIALSPVLPNVDLAHSRVQFIISGTQVAEIALALSSWNSHPRHRPE